MRTRIKICGMTRAEDAAHAVSCGADAIGVIAYAPSPRTALIADAASLRAAVPAFVSLVLVTVDMEKSVHQDWIDALQPDMLQFHGNESPMQCASFGLPYLKSIRVRDEVDLTRESDRYGDARAILLDTYVPGIVGGTGSVFDWERARAINPMRLVLAGGLNAENVADAISRLQPLAVDVASGVELRPGIKDHQLVRDFVQAAERAS